MHTDDELQALVRVLRETQQDLIPVVDDKGRVVGSVDEIDLVEVVSPAKRTFPYGPRKLAREGLLSEVGDVMTPRPSTAREDDDLADALRRMESLRLPQLVVVDQEMRLIGLLRGRDVYCHMYRSAQAEEGDLDRSENPRE